MDPNQQSDAIKCTLAGIPISASLLQKSRLPLGLHVYPFANDPDIPVISETTIVRCRVCRTYINPFITIDQWKWQCNVCRRTNDLPSDFFFDSTTQQYIDINSKAELTNNSVEFVASVDYMIRPPQPACYIFVFDCSRFACEIGYISVLANAIYEKLDEIPGDARASIGFIAYDSNVHYFSFGGTQVVHHVCPDIETEVLPCMSENILANIDSKREMITDFLTVTLAKFPSQDESIPIIDSKSAMGPAIKAAYKILAPIGGRITVIQAQLPNYGASEDGSVLKVREDPNKRTIKMDKNAESLTPLLNPATDFYKRVALECCEHQIAVDLFNLSTTYSDLASVSPLAKYSAGSVYHYENDINNPTGALSRFDADLRHYLVRPIGFESVLRIRCSQGLAVHTFHGNFFVRSTDLLVLANANPDASYAMQISIEDLRPETQNVCFQVAVLHTTPNGERRIRVHTANYPTVTTLSEVIHSANQNTIIAMLAKMAVDRSLQMSIGEAKEALIGAGVDLIETYKLAEPMRAQVPNSPLPSNLRLIPLFILALLKHKAFRVGVSTKLDDRSAAMDRLKTLPLDDIITYIYPDLYPIHVMNDEQNYNWQNPCHLSAAMLERNGAYLLDSYDNMIIYICESIDPHWVQDVFGVSNWYQIPDYADTLPVSSSSTMSQNMANNYPPRHHQQPQKPPHQQQPYQQSYQQQTYQQSYQQQQQHLPYQQQHQYQYQPSRPVDDGLGESKESPFVDLIPLPERENMTSSRLREFINYLLAERAHMPKFYILRENSRLKNIFTQYLIDDRSESFHSFYEFMEYLQQQVKQ